ncbi:hypothetical protein [Paenibacillus sp. MMS20-IR301]|uniref:hypothetical protein n=1 Tax=Paenibacillus sp. MMS20-IR301 TaxID=2895946 RepID=UPI0028E85AC3|nr:hypothetical protein [Paenibacillus sp. MMS20-IR301]WNS43270.1 hypothetical protein LOS79_30755 [Paenibacillus sp. MMS20-IR301]
MFRMNLHHENNFDKVTIEEKEYSDDLDDHTSIISDISLLTTCSTFNSFDNTISNSRKLALVLYSMPQMIRNTFLSFTAHDVKDSELLNKLEDVWMELDELVIEYLS